MNYEALLKFTNQFLALIFKGENDTMINVCLNIAKVKVIHQVQLINHLMWVNKLNLPKGVFNVGASIWMNNGNVLATKEK